MDQDRCYYYPNTAEMRLAGLYGPYLDLIGPWPTIECRNEMKGRAEAKLSGKMCANFMCFITDELVQTPVGVFCGSCFPHRGIKL